MATPSEKPKYYADTNGMPRTLDGRVTHLGVTEGDVAARILSVGSAGRAHTLAKLLETPTLVDSARGFTTITGGFGGVPVSIIATGMGAPNMDFVVREARAVVDGPMAMCRLGTCGSIDVPTGTVVANGPGCYWIARDPDAWSSRHSSNGATTSAPKPYVVSSIQKPDATLSGLVLEKLVEALGDEKAIDGLNASTDSFYGSQARIDPNFDDRNADLLEATLLAGTASVEMESFQLVHLAACARVPIKAATAAIVCAERNSGDVIAADDLRALELEAGRAILEALTVCPLEEPGSSSS